MKQYKPALSIVELVFAPEAPKNVYAYGMGRTGSFVLAISAGVAAAAAAAVLFAGFGLSRGDLPGIESDDHQQQLSPLSHSGHGHPKGPEEHPAGDHGSAESGRSDRDGWPHTIPGTAKTPKFQPGDPRAGALMLKLMNAAQGEFASVLIECIRKLPIEFIASEILRSDPSVFCPMLGASLPDLESQLPRDYHADLAELCRLLFESHKDPALVEAALTFDPLDEGRIDSFIGWDPERVAQILERLGPAHFKSAAVLFRIMTGLEAAGMPGRCGSFASELLRLQHQNSFAFHLLVSIAPEEAASIMAEFVQDSPEDHFLRYRLGSSLLACGNRPAAFESFKAALDLEPGDPDYMQGLIESDTARAAVVLAEAAEKKPSDQEAIGKLARAYLDLGRRDDAFSLACRAFKMEPDDPEWTDLMMRIDPIAALSEITEMARAESSDPVLLGLLGRARMRTGDRAGAFDAYRSAYELSGDSAEAHAAWADEMIKADPAASAELISTTLKFDAQCLSDVRAWKAADAAGLPFAPDGGGFSWVFSERAPGPFSEHDFDSDGDSTAIGRMDPGMLGKLGRSLIASGRAADGAALVEYALARLEGSMFQGMAEAARLAGALGAYSPGRAMAVLDGILAHARRSRAPEVIGAAGDAYREMGRRAEALSAYREALRSDPTSEEWITAIRDLEGRW